MKSKELDITSKINEKKFELALSCQKRQGAKDKFLSEKV
jgi:hypothetical protein